MLINYNTMANTTAFRGIKSDPDNPSTKVSIPVNKRVTQQMKVQAALADKTIPVIWEEAARFYLEAKGIYLNEKGELIDNHVNGNGKS
jgi:hypothetical protein